jgi:hypothetical protein
MGAPLRRRREGRELCGSGDGVGRFFGIARGLGRRRAASEGRCVGDQPEGATLLVGVRLDDVRRRVGHVDVDAEIGESCGEEPVAAVGSATVQDLRRELGVARLEKPEVAGVGGEGDGMGDAGLAVGLRPRRIDEEAAAAETERRVGGAAGVRGRRPERRQSNHRDEPEDSFHGERAGRPLSSMSSGRVPEPLGKCSGRPRPVRTRRGPRRGRVGARRVR